MKSMLMNGPPLLAAILLGAMTVSCGNVDNYVTVADVVEEAFSADIGIPINLENTAEHDLALQPTIALRDDGGGGTTEFNCNVDFSGSDGLVNDVGKKSPDTGKYIYNVNSSSTRLAEESEYQTSCNSANVTHSSLAAIKTNSPTVPVPSWTSTPRYMMRC